MLATGLTGGLAQLAMTHAYSLDQAARLSTLGYLTVALSHGFGAVFLDEPPSAHQLAGTTLVIAAGVLLASQALTRRIASDTP